MRRAGSIAPIALLLWGCSMDTGPVPPPVVIVATEPTGTLVVSWTIELHADSAACTQAAVSTIRIHLATAGGADAGTYEDACKAFSTSIRLAPDTYLGSAVLLGGGGQGTTRTSLVELQSFTILGGDVITIPIDFSVTTFTPN